MNLYEKSSKIFTTKAGYKARIRDVNTHLCGYVFVGESHPAFGLSEDTEVTIAEFNIANVPYKLVATKSLNVIVHGGITYAEHEGDAWVLGFDCAHVGDTREYCNEAFVERECERLARQLKAMEKPI